MSALLDTNVLVAASVRQHPHFEPADRLLRRCAQGEEQGIVHAHSLLEYHSAVTQLPGALAVPPAVVETLLHESILSFVQLIQLTSEQILATQRRAGRHGLVGGIVYDYFHLVAAEQAGVDRLYTFNVAHFRRLAGEDHHISILPPP